MAIINNNVENVKFLRNGQVFSSRTLAYNALTGFTLTDEQDGTAILARYTAEDTKVKTLVGWVYKNGNTEYITIFDIEGASADVEKLREEINAKLGDGITSANTATAQLAALSGSTFVPGTSSSAKTSVEGAKAYAYDLLGTLDYEDAAVEGQYVSQVTQADGKIAVTRVELPSSADTAVSKKFVTSVAEDKGQIVVSRGEISSSANTMVLADNTDGGVNFEVNIDNNTIIQDAETKKLKVADAALVQYEGDTKTIAISPVQDGVRTVSSIITLSSITPSSEIVKEEYALKNASGETIGSTIKIYKDSHIVSITYQDNPELEHYQNLIYTYIDVNGETKVEYVDISELILETEFASGITVTNHIAHGAIDPTSETFLTVGANGFKLSGVQDAIDAAVDDLDERLDVVEDEYISGVSVNGKAVTVANHIAPVSITSATSSMTSTSTEAIVIDTDSTTGKITLGLGTIDCGTY